MRRRYINLHRDIFPEGYLSYGSTQAHSNVLVIEHERNSVDHYNPRHVPVPLYMADFMVLADCGLYDAAARYDDLSCLIEDIYLSLSHLP